MLILQLYYTSRFQEIHSYFELRDIYANEKNIDVNQRKCIPEVFYENINKLNNSKIHQLIIKIQFLIIIYSTDHNVQILIILVDSQTNIMYLIMLI